jgi:tol-pal system protein YbgF
METREALKFCIVTCLSLTFAATAWAQAPVVRPASPAEISQRLARIEQLLQNQGLLDMLQQLESLQAEVSQLRGELELQKRAIEELNQRQRALYADIDQRLQGLQQTPAPELTLGPGDAGEPATPPLQTLAPAFEPAEQSAAPTAESTLDIQMLPSTPAPRQELGTMAPPVAAADQPMITGPLTGAATDIAPDEPAPAAEPAATDTDRMQAEYDQAFDLLKLGQYEPAIQGFTAYLDKYPAGDFSDNAQYWLGEAYYVTRRFDQALQEYNRLVINFPHSQKYTHALLKIGYSLQELGRIDEAKKYLQALVRQYPGETASRLAEERLKSIALTEQQGGAPLN